MMTLFNTTIIMGYYKQTNRLNNSERGTTMTFITGGLLNGLQAIAEARKQLDALPQNTVVIIAKVYYTPNSPVYEVYATLGSVNEDGEIVKS